jgi:glutamyl-Q tRNA(Asp) synthetase
MTGYIGRFAPSPTGPLHFGSLLTALASFLDARANNGIWRVRMEDLDPPREQEGAAKVILDSLLAHGLVWDGDVLFQSTRLDAYKNTVQALLDNGLAYACTCSRLQLKQHAIYNGACRNKRLPLNRKSAARIKCGPEIISFNDGIQGLQSNQMDTELGDFVIFRKDGYTAYQLAVALDDDFQKISHVVRGSDLLDSTTRQLFILKRLGLSTPEYCHLPVVVNQDGQKLSKQTCAPAINPDRNSENLYHALIELGQNPDPGLARMPVQKIINWAISHWSLDKVPKKLTITGKAPHL